jgi:hypothetical protein
MFIGASAILTKTILVGFAMYVLAMGLLNPWFVAIHIQIQHFDELL